MMRSYIKTMGLTLGIFYLLGSIYEIIKRFFGRKKAKVVPTQRKFAAQNDIKYINNMSL